MYTMATDAPRGRGRKPAKKQAVGVRELRQNLSACLARVKRGARLEVTEHGRPVALLVPVPVPETDSWLERMIAEGRATRPKHSTKDLPPPIWRPPGSRPLSEILDEQREDKI